MSDVHEVNLETNEPLEADDGFETEPDAGDDTEAEGGDDDGDLSEGEGAKPKAAAVDWEKRAHDKEGQAARERSRRRAAERRASELEERLDRLEAASKRSAPSKRQQLIARLRDDSDEPLADLEDLKEIARSLLEEDAEEAERTQQQQAHERKISTLTTAMTEFEADFRLDHKDYDDACKHYKQQRAEELEDMGYSGQRLVNKLATELYGLVEDAIKGGRDPAEMVYGMAKRRGYAATADDATRKLQKLQNGAKAASAAPRAGAGSGRVTYDQVTKAKGAARDKLWAQLRKQEMGGR